jgi:hypothetical protein
MLRYLFGPLPWPGFPFGPLEANGDGAGAAPPFGLLAFGFFFSLLLRI